MLFSTISNQSYSAILASVLLPRSSINPVDEIAYYPLCFRRQQDRKVRFLGWGYHCINETKKSCDYTIRRTAAEQQNAMLLEFRTFYFGHLAKIHAADQEWMKCSVVLRHEVVGTSLKSRVQRICCRCINLWLYVMMLVNNVPNRTATALMDVQFSPSLKRPSTSKARILR